MEPIMALANNLELRIKLYQRALEDHYIKNPHKENENKIKTLTEAGVPISAAGLSLPLIPKGSKYKTIVPAAGIGLGLLNSSLGFLGRGQKYVREEGVDSNLLGYKTRPLIQDPNKKNF